jgi:hypothetical protein
MHIRSERPRSTQNRLMNHRPLAGGTRATLPDSPNVRTSPSSAVPPGWAGQPANGLCCNSGVGCLPRRRCCCQSCLPPYLSASPLLPPKWPSPASTSRPPRAPSPRASPPPASPSVSPPPPTTATALTAPVPTPPPSSPVGSTASPRSRASTVRARPATTVYRAHAEAGAAAAAAQGAARCARVCRLPKDQHRCCLASHVEMSKGLRVLPTCWALALLLLGLVLLRLRAHDTRT